MRQENDQVLRNIALLLQKAGVIFGYLYDQELYSGALVYDGGMDESFGIHAQRVYDIFKNNGVRKVITVDPHTTNILRDGYPKFIKNYDLEVTSYLEILAEKGLPPVSSQNSELVIHDSCVYARYEGTIESPRELLRNTGITLKEPELSKRATYCCGGPIESLFPGKAHEIAKNRINQLMEKGENIVTMCPICQVNLRKAAQGGCQINDISKTLSKSYLS
jgi:Fe-S oxidoreductase